MKGRVKSPSLAFAAAVVVLLISVFGFFPLAIELLSGIQSVDAGRHTTLFVHNDAASVAWRMTVVVIAAVAVACFVGRYFLGAPSIALLAIGWIFLAMPFSFARIDELVRTVPTMADLGGIRQLLIWEAVIFALIGLFVAAIATSGKTLGEAKVTWSKRSYLSGLIILFASVLIVMVVARTTLAGQGVAAAMIATIAGVAAARILAWRAHTMIFVLAVMGMPVLSAVAALAIPQSEWLARAFGGGLPAFANMMPWDWLAGGIPGVALGEWWAVSLVSGAHKSETRGDGPVAVGPAGLDA
ncbi:MAG: hypothetical protein AAGB34_03435 [Planctomycetota bacterium]